jgi:hypothetical protein
MLQCVLFSYFPLIFWYIYKQAVGLVFVAVVELWKAGARTGKGSTSLDSDTWWLIVVCMSFVSVQWYNIPPPVAIAIGGIAGLGWYAVNMET